MVPLVCGFEVGPPGTGSWTTLTRSVVGLPEVTPYRFSSWMLHWVGHDDAAAMQTMFALSQSGSVTWLAWYQTTDTLPLAPAAIHGHITVPPVLVIVIGDDQVRPSSLV